MTLPPPTRGETLLSLARVRLANTQQSERAHASRRAKRQTGLCLTQEQTHTEETPRGARTEEHGNGSQGEVASQYDQSAPDRI